jgi:hypothetical protein
MQRLVTRIMVVMLSLAIQLVFLGLGGAFTQAVAQGVEESVTGHVEFVNTISGNLARYSVNAIRHRDGSVSGEFEIHVYSPTGEFLLSSHVSIVCFTITGNIARIGGIVDRSKGLGAPPGAEGFITVVDNGEGANDLPDLASGPGVGPGTAFAHCTTGLPRLLFTVDNGNIQVQPSGL